MALRRSTLHHRFRTGIWCPTVFLCIGLACLVHRTQSSKGGQVYTNQFAVEIHGGEAAAAEVARRHGFIYQGQVCFEVLHDFCGAFSRSFTAVAFGT